MEKIKQAYEKDVFDMAKEAIKQTSKDLEVQGVPPIKHRKPTPAPQGEATDTEIKAVVSFFPNL